MSKSQPDTHQVEHESPPHKYFTMMLNMADDDLDPYQYRLLAHYVRIAGNGGTKGEGLRDTAKATRMSVHKVRAARIELVTMGYLRVIEPNEEQRKRGISATITVLDRWRENVNRYAKSDTPPVSNLTQGCETSDTPPVSNLPLKNKNVSEEPVKEQKKRDSAQVQSRALDEFNATLSKKNKVVGEIEPKGGRRSKKSAASQSSARWLESTAHFEALVAALELDPATLNGRAGDKYREAAADLKDATAEPDEIRGLVIHIRNLAKRDDWSSWGMNAIVSRAPTYLSERRKHQPKPEPPAAPAPPERELTPEEAAPITEEQKALMDEMLEAIAEKWNANSRPGMVGRVPKTA